MKFFALAALVAAGLFANTADVQFRSRGYSYPSSYPTYSYPSTSYPGSGYGTTSYYNGSTIVGGSYAPVYGNGVVTNGYAPYLSGGIVTSSGYTPVVPSTVVPNATSSYPVLPGSYGPVTATRPPTGATRRLFTTATRMVAAGNTRPTEVLLGQQPHGCWLFSFREPDRRESTSSAR